jgi:glycerol uptake operon antiterminator
MLSVADMKRNFMANPVIAAVRDVSGLYSALKSPVEFVFLLDASLMNIRQRVQQIKGAGKKAFVHLDMVAGLGKDAGALEFLWEDCRPDGVILTKPNMIQTARHLGFITVQRLFVLDSLSVQTGLKIANESRPDFIEVMPGAVVAKIIAQIRQKSSVPVIAGGLVENRDEVAELLKAGALAVSTSKTDLWKEVFG